MGNLDEFLANNEQFAAKFSQEDGAKPMPPARKTAIITCMDARLHPEAALGLAIGDSHVIRNAGEQHGGIKGL
jgi:carbonic anhydrase